MNQRRESNSSSPAASSGRQIHATRTHHLYQNTKHLFNFENPPRKRNQAFPTKSKLYRRFTWDEARSSCPSNKGCKKNRLQWDFPIQIHLDVPPPAASDPLKETERQKRKPNQQAERKKRTKRDATSSVFRHRVRSDQNIAGIWSKKYTQTSRKEKNAVWHRSVLRTGFDGCDTQAGRGLHRSNGFRSAWCYEHHGAHSQAGSSWKMESSRVLGGIFIYFLSCVCDYYKNR